MASQSVVCRVSGYGAAASGAKLPLTGMSVLTVPAQPAYANGVKSLCWGIKLQGLTVLPQSFRQVGCRIRDVRVGCLFCGLGLLMSLSVQQYTIGNSRRVLNG